MNVRRSSPSARDYKSFAIEERRTNSRIVKAGTKRGLTSAVAMDEEVNEFWFVRAVAGHHFRLTLL